MKIKNHLIAFCLLALGGTTGFCQTPTESPQPPGPGGPPGGGGRMREMRQKMRDDLTPEERQRFDTARNKAMESPEIQELKKNAEKANRELFQAMRQKMLEIDPGLADIIKKHEGGDKKGKGDKMGRERKGNPPPGAGNLTEEEREKVMAARAKAKENPSVKAAEEVKKNAKTPEDRQAAMEAYREAMHNAMIQADPSVEPLLEKMGPPPPAPPKASDMDERTDPPAPPMPGTP